MNGERSGQALLAVKSRPPRKPLARKYEALTVRAVALMGGHERRGAL
jgi:hypothetical protein